MGYIFYNIQNNGRKMKVLGIRNSRISDRKQVTRNKEQGTSDKNKKQKQGASNKEQKTGSK
jgi:hypothetical protein